MNELELRVIRGEDVRRLLGWAECVDAVAAAMIEVSRGGAVMPLRQVMPVPSAGGLFGTMPGCLSEPSAFGIKLLSLMPGNPAAGYSSHLGLYVLFEPEHGRPVAVMEASALTAIRTAAASVVATRALARPGVSTLAILGTGEEARAHLECWTAVRPFERVIVWGRRIEAARELAAHARRIGVPSVEVADSTSAAVRTADVVCTVTAARTAILNGADVRPGTHLCLVGASVASAREVDDECVARARYFVDSRASAMAQAGELLDAIAASVVTEDHVAGEIGEVLGGAIAGRRSDEEVTIYKSLGVAAQDIAAATIVHRRAVELGVGSIVAI
ncbi:MAG: ornithine cyclodeaminase family protein [Steroidobacteraceae bacterium]